MAASSDNPLATPAAPRVHEQPFGDNKLTIPTGAPDTDANHYAFLDTDKETATDHADFRQYSNAQGRWMAPDPYDGSYDPNNPQSLNRYVYAMNSPASDLDPSGLWSLQASAVCSFCSSIWNAIRNIFSSVGDEDGGSSGGGGGGGGGTIDVNSPYMQYNDPMNYVNPTTTVWGPSSFGSGGGGVGGNAPINVPSLINNAKGLLSQRCKSKFGQKIPGYTTSRFFNTLSNATINQYPFATPPQDASSYGADAVTHPPGGPIDLLPNFYGRDPTSQAFVLIHEGIHLFGRGNLGDSAVQNLFGLPVTGNTENITQYIAAGCYP